MEATRQVEQSTVFDLGCLLDAGDSAVVTLEAGDTRLAAHRAVLAARSPVFAAMFEHDTLEASSGVVAIPDVEGPVLRHLLAYFYTLQVPQLPGEAHQLLAAADKYRVSALKEACERQVASRLSVETAAAAAVLAVRHDCSSLKEAAVAYIKSRGFEVMATRGWADAVRTQPEDIVELSRLLTETSVPPPAASETGPQTSSCSQTAASRHTPAPDDAAVSSLRRLSRKEKGQRLIRAAEEGAVGELGALLEAGADVGAEDGVMRTALHWASYRGHEDVAGRLLAAGAAVDARDIWRGTPLHWAAAGGSAAVVRLLLAAGAPHNYRSVSGWSPLHWAAARGHREAAAALLAAGADRAATTNGGSTPLGVANRNNLRQLEELL